MNNTLVYNTNNEYEYIDNWNDKDSNNNIVNTLELNVAGSKGLKYSVTTTNCNAKDVTKWNVGALHGGAIQSQDSGRCLEVFKFEFMHKGKEFKPESVR